MENNRDNFEEKKECFESHPPLVLNMEGNNYSIYGGNCHTPIIKDANIYISLDKDPPVFDWEKPWYENKNNLLHIRFPIEDMFIPTDTEDFNNCLDYVIEQLRDNKKIHVGCIGGHGRTGVFLSALNQKIEELNKSSNKDSISHIRENYCKHAVETTLQVIYLNEVFKITIPKEELNDVNEFKKIFKEETGIDFKDLKKKKVHLDDISDVLMEVDDILMSLKHNRRDVVTKDDFLNPKKISM